MVCIVLFIGLENGIGKDPTGACAKEIGLALGMMTKLTALNISGKSRKTSKKYLLENTESNTLFGCIVLLLL